MNLIVQSSITYRIDAREVAPSHSSAVAINLDNFIIMSMNRSIDHFVIKKKRYPASVFRFSDWPRLWANLNNHLHRPVVDLASSPRGRRVSGVASGRWEVMIP